MITIVSLTGENGILKRTQVAKDTTNKNQAAETMNLKITNIQISSYAENQELPSLQYVADKLCEDNDMEYVLLESKKTASLDKIIVSEGKSIYTKLKEYPYKFEINSSLQLASINGVKISTPTTDGKCNRYIAVKTSGYNGKLKMQVNIPEADDQIIKSIDYYIDNQMVYSGKEKSYTETGLQVDKEYEVYAIVNYENTKISSKVTIKNSQVAIEDGLVGYWPLTQDLNPKVANELTGNFVTSSETAVPDFSQEAYKMNTSYYLMSEKNLTLYDNSTLACQFKLNSISNKYFMWEYYNIPFGAIAQSSSNCYGIFISSSSSKIYNGEYGSGTNFTYSGSYYDNWINAAFVQDSTGKSTLYYNGKEIVTGMNGVRNKIRLLLGSNCDGYIKNFVIYNRALSADEVGRIFE